MDCYRAKVPRAQGRCAPKQDTDNQRKPVCFEIAERRNRLNGKNLTLRAGCKEGAGYIRQQAAERGDHEVQRVCTENPLSCR
ncbi:MAG: hypothetical protein ACREOO_27455 [bacterium]